MPLPRPCPVTPPSKVRRSARHIGPAWWRARLYGAALRAGLAGHPVGPVIARPRRGRAARLRLPGRTMRGPPPSAAARPCLSASAPGGRAWRARPPRRRGAAPLATAAPRIPPCAGPGFWPGPLPTAGKAGDSLDNRPARGPSRHDTMANCIDSLVQKLNTSTNATDDTIPGTGVARCPGAPAPVPPPLPFSPLPAAALPGDLEAGNLERWRRLLEAHAQRESANPGCGVRFRRRSPLFCGLNDARR